MKSTSTYWNTLSDLNSDKWEDIEGSEGNLSQLTIAEDSDTGDYTRLTKFKAGYNSARVEVTKQHGQGIYKTSIPSLDGLSLNGATVGQGI